MPDVPGDFEFPTQEILRFSLCQLRDADWELNDKNVYPAFDAEHYCVKVALQPNVDRELEAKAGLTGKRTSLTRCHSNTWIGEAFPGAGSLGAGFDIRGHQDGSVNFIVKSKLLLSKNLRIDCQNNWSPTQPHACREPWYLLLADQVFAGNAE